jgi:hypothetical protein
VTAR